ncbi:MAG: hypothetical protein V4864_25945 [Pseudomonadota bacterium]
MLTGLDIGVTDLMAAYLLSKPRPRLGPTCTGPYHDHEGGCRRPIWGDGRVLLGKGNIRFDLCARCYLLDNALHGKYRTMQANPAAAKLDGVGIERLTFTARPTLPEVGAHQPDTFPESWT